MAEIYSTRKAQVGDRIRVLENNYPYFIAGDVGIVIETDDYDVFVDFNGQGNDAVSGDGKWHVPGGEYHVIKSESPTPAPEPPEPAENTPKLTQSQRIETVADEVKALLIRKNTDYGDSFSKQFEKYGILSGLIRMDDKMARLQTLASGQEAQVTDESLIDTVRDLIGYGVLLLVELQKQVPAQAK